MSGCLRDTVAALVDGELDHPARERALRHLTHCEGCRREVEAQRRLKARLLGLGGLPPAPDLSHRLLGLAGAQPPLDQRTGPMLSGRSTGPDDERLRPSADRRLLPAPDRRGRAHPRNRSAGGRSPRRRVLRRTALRRGVLATSVFAAAGVAAALALGSPSADPTTPLDPATDTFVTQFVRTTGDGTAVTRAGFYGGGR